MATSAMRSSTTRRSLTCGSGPTSPAISTNNHFSPKSTGGACAVAVEAEHPMSPAEVEEKARELMAPVLGDERVNELFDSIRNLEAVTDISKLRPLLMKI